MATLFLRMTASLLLLDLAITISSEEVKLDHHLEHFLEHLTKVRHPAAYVNTSWRETRSFIYDQFRSLNLETTYQLFNSSINDNNVDKRVEGKNVIAIAEGPKGGPVLLVGADYDTPLLPQSPLENNGAGVAALMEIARNYMDQIYNKGVYNITGTVLFVAFDINTMKYDGTFIGQPGSYHFVYQWLWPYLQRTKNPFRGAIILDSISKYNMEDASQVLPANFGEVFPEAKEDIVRRGKKGDFLTLITRKSKDSERLSQTLYDHYSKNGKTRRFRLVDLTFEDGSELGETFSSMAGNQSHIHFWKFKPSSTAMPLPAILLTDTGIYRKSADICQSPCSASTFLTPIKKEFLTKTVDAVVQTLASLQTDRPAEGNPAIGLSSSMPITVALLIFSRIFH